MRIPRYRCALVGAFLLAAVGLMSLPTNLQAKSPFKSGVVDAIDKVVDLMAEGGEGHRSRGEIKGLHKALEQLLKVLEHRGGQQNQRGHMHHGMNQAKGQHPQQRRQHAGQTIGGQAGKQGTTKDATQSTSTKTGIGNRVGKNSPGSAKQGPGAKNAGGTAKLGTKANVGGCKLATGPKGQNAKSQQASGNNARAKPSGSNAKNARAQAPVGAAAKTNVGARPGANTNRAAKAPAAVNHVSVKTNPRATSVQPNNPLNHKIDRPALPLYKNQATPNKTSAPAQAKAARAPATQHFVNAGPMANTMRGMAPQARPFAGMSVGHRPAVQTFNGLRRR